MRKIFLILLLLLSFWNLAFAEEAYNDECWVEQNNNWWDKPVAYKLENNNIALKTTNIKQEYFLSSTSDTQTNTWIIYDKNIDFWFNNFGGKKMISYQDLWITKEEIKDKLQNNSYFKYLYKTGSIIYVANPIDQWKIYKINLETKKLEKFNNLANNNFNFLFAQDWYIYYKNQVDENKIYKIKETCSNPNAKWFEVWNNKQTNYIFEKWEYIYYSNPDDENRLYKIKKDWSDINNNWIKVSNKWVRKDWYSSWLNWTYEYMYLFSDNSYIYVKNDKWIYKINIEDNNLDDINQIYNGWEINYIDFDWTYIYFSSFDNTTTDWPELRSIQINYYKLKKDWTDKQLIFSSSWEYFYEEEIGFVDANYIYLANMQDFKIYKISKNWDSLNKQPEKLFDEKQINKLFVDKQDNSLYYFTPRDYFNIYKYNLDWTNKQLLKNDWIYNSEEILLNSEIKNLKIKVNSNNRNYKFYLSNTQNTKEIYNSQTDNIFVDIDNAWIYIQWMDWLSQTDKDFLSKINPWDELILNKATDNIKVQLESKTISSDDSFAIIYFTKPLKNIQDRFELQTIDKVERNYTQIPTQSLNWETKLNLQDLFWENTGKLYYKLELNQTGEEANISNVEITNWDLQKQIDFWEITLTQQVKEPYQEKRKLWLWAYIWKQQMWSGIILRYSFENKENVDVRMVVDVYDVKTRNKVWQYFNDFNNTNTWEVIIGNLPAWSYFWEANLITKDNILSKRLDFWNNLFADFNIFDWFEPYANGYKFMNNSPNPSIFSWSVTIKLDLDKYIYENKIVFNRKINDWNKWKIFNNVFDIPDERRRIDSFIWIWLNWTWAFQWWNCFWMSLSAMAKYRWYNDFLNKYAKWLNDNIWTWTIWEKIQEPNTKPTNVAYQKNLWDIDNDNLKWIISLQIYQYWKDIKDLQRRFDKKKNNWMNVVEQFKNNPDKNYILLIWWKKTKNSEEQWHAVVPYRLEKENDYYKLYIWDNNIPYSNVIDKDENWKKITVWSYKQYIKIYSDWSWFYENLKKDWPITTIIWLLDIDNLVSLPKQTRVVWTDENEIKYGLSWEGNIYLEDENGNITWYKDWETLEQIPWTEIYKEIWIVKWQQIKNTYKQIYIPDTTKLDISKLKLKIQSTKNETYNLNIISKDFFTYFQNIETNSWDLDEFKITRKDIQVNFDKNKTWDYDLLVDNFKDNWTWTVFIPQVKTKILHEYQINWDKVVKDEKWAITYKLDTNNDWKLDNQDKQIELNPQYIDNTAPITKLKIKWFNLPKINKFKNWFKFWKHKNKQKDDENKEKLDKYLNQVKIKLKAKDNKDWVWLENIYYNLNNWEYIKYTKEIKLKKSWKYTLKYYSKDLFWNKEKIKEYKFEIVNPRDRIKNKLKLKENKEEIKKEIKNNLKECKNKFNFKNKFKHNFRNKD